MMATKIITRCASCKWQRKKCSELCIMAPHFPQSDPHKFETVHRVFGTNNVLKTLQGLEESERAGAVNSMVFEANARLTDPVNGSASAVYQLEKQISELESQLGITQAEVETMRRKRDELQSIVTADYQFLPPTQQRNDASMSKDFEDL